MAGESGGRRYSSEDEKIMFGRDRTPPKEMRDMADAPALKMVTEKEEKSFYFKGN